MERAKMSGNCRGGAAPNQKDGGALNGLKVADFSWVIAGPMATKCLGDYGATVVRIESSRRPDVSRMAAGPWVDGKPGLNHAAPYHVYNTSKYGVTLNLNDPRALTVARRLVMWSDVVFENFTPGNMERWDLGYEQVRQEKPDLIMIRCTMQGQTGIHKNMAGFGVELASMAGFQNLVGWPDRGPVGTGSAYTDYIVPWYALIATMAALEHRDRTGEGLCVDLSQFEASLSFLSPAILDYTVNNRITGRSGNRCLRAAPHGVYRCKGEDRWCAISVFTEEQWKALCSAIGYTDLAGNPNFASLPRRKENEDELDRLIGAWTKDRPAEEVMSTLQEVGVGAGVVQNGRDLCQDPHLKDRKHFQWLEHPELGSVMYEAPPFSLSRTPSRLRPAPSLGEHNEYVCREFLGMSDEEFIQLHTNGAFE